MKVSLLKDESSLGKDYVVVKRLPGLKLNMAICLNSDKLQLHGMAKMEE